MTDGAESTYAGWLDVPVWYLACTEDSALPVHVQRAFLKRAKDSGANITVREIRSGHSPFLSMPKETAECILEAIASFM